MQATKILCFAAGDFVLYFLRIKIKEREKTDDNKEFFINVLLELMFVSCCFFLSIKFVACCSFMG